ncbi:hypothetical protein EW445_18025 [Salmonella enterica subsp. enterica serovar Newport]|nr:hypothetical protein [Salmonella enterica subsp. enterica serovar Newport]
MFNKKSRPQQTVSVPQPVPADSTTTVIGEGTVMEGNILRGRNAEVYGGLTGDITLPDGTVRVMPGGTVSGTIRAAGIVIGGAVEGCCEAQDVTVLEEGVLRGICRSVLFSIKPGGVFTGTSEPLPEGQREACPVVRSPGEDESEAGEYLLSPDQS